MSNLFGENILNFCPLQVLFFQLPNSLNKTGEGRFKIRHQGEMFEAFLGFSPYYIRLWARPARTAQIALRASNAASINLIDQNTNERGLNRLEQSTRSLQRQECLRVFGGLRKDVGGQSLGYFGVEMSGSRRAMNSGH